MFAYDEALIERYPTIRAGVIHATNLSNVPSSPELLDEYRAEQRAAVARLDATAVALSSSACARAGAASIVRQVEQSRTLSNGTSPSASPPLARV